MNYRAAPEKSAAEIVAEWDTLAPIRREQIEKGTDITYTHVLVPTILSLIPNAGVKAVLDAGCGIGSLTRMLSELYDVVVGIDPSSKSIEIACESGGAKPKYLTRSMELHGACAQGEFDVVVANMVLMDALDLNAFLAGAANSLRTQGHLVFTIPHPWFWPEYYGYANQPWFRYTDTIVVEGPFKISEDARRHPVSTHIHRPLERIVEALTNAGFVIEALFEPMPDAATQELYSVRWKMPRYLAGRCRLSTPTDYISASPGSGEVVPFQHVPGQAGVTSPCLVRLCSNG